MKSLFFIIGIIELVGLLLGRWLSILVTSAGIYTPTVYMGQSTTVTMALLSISFAPGSGPGFAGLFTIPMLFILAYTVKNRTRDFSAFAPTVIYAISLVIVFMGLSSWVVLDHFSMSAKLSPSHAPIKPSAAGLVIYASLLTGFITLIASWLKPNVAGPKA